MAKRYMIVLLLLGLLIPIPVAKGITTNNGVVVSLVKPAGGGDFTTLQAWENWADDQTNAAQWAECYSGGDLGAVTINGWVSTSSPTAYPRIYVPYSERHKGKDDGTGAGIVLSNDVCAVRNYLYYTRVEGLRIEQTVLASTDITVMHAITGVILDSNLIIYNITNTISGGTSAAFRFWTLGDTNGTFIARNNIVFGKKQVKGLYQGFNLLVSSPYTNTILIYNNTMEQLDFSGFRFNGDGMLLTLENNIGMDSLGGGGTKLDYVIGSTILSTNFNNNMSSDGTATNFGGTSNLVNMISSNQFVNTNSDWNLLSTANAKDAGKTESGFNQDAVGTIRVPPWDMGAMEIAYTGLWTYTSIANGYWTNNTTWTSSPAGGTYPSASNDLATITNTVTCDVRYLAISNIVVSNVGATVTGTLFFYQYNYPMTNASPITLHNAKLQNSRNYTMYYTGDITVIGTNEFWNWYDGSAEFQGMFITTNTTDKLTFRDTQAAGNVNIHLRRGSPLYTGMMSIQEAKVFAWTNACLGVGDLLVTNGTLGTATTLTNARTSFQMVNSTWVGQNGVGQYTINFANNPTLILNNSVVYSYQNGFNIFNPVYVTNTVTLTPAYYDCDMRSDISGSGKIICADSSGNGGKQYLRGTNNTFSGGLYVDHLIASYVTMPPIGTNAGGIGIGPVILGLNGRLYLTADAGRTNWTLTNAISGKGVIRIETGTNCLTMQDSVISPGTNTVTAGVLTIQGKGQFSKVAANPTLVIDVISTNLTAGTGFDQLSVTNGDVTFASSITNCNLIVDCHSVSLSTNRLKIVSATGANFTGYAFASVVFSNAIGAMSIEYLNEAINIYYTPYTFTAKATGTWDNTNTWSCVPAGGTYPMSNDYAIIGGTNWVDANIDLTGSNQPALITLAGGNLTHHPDGNVTIRSPINVISNSGITVEESYASYGNRGFILYGAITGTNRLTSYGVQLNLYNEGTNFSGGWDIADSAYIQPFTNGCFGTGPLSIVPGTHRGNNMRVWADQIIPPSIFNVQGSSDTRIYSYGSFVGWNMVCTNVGLFLNNKSVTGGTFRLNGPANRFGGYEGGTMTISSPMSGSGVCKISATDGYCYGPVVIAGDNTNFTGGFTLDDSYNAGAVRKLYIKHTNGLGSASLEIWPNIGGSNTVYFQRLGSAADWIISNRICGNGIIQVEDGSSSYRLTIQDAMVCPGTNTTAGILAVKGKFGFAKVAVNPQLMIDVVGTNIVAGTGFDQLNVSAGDVTFASSITNCVLIVDCHSNALSSVRRTIISASGANFAPYVFSSVVLSNTVGSVTVEYVNGSINLYTAEAVGVARNKLIPQYDNNLTVKNSLWP